MSSISYRIGAAEDWPAVSALLQSASLPLEGAREHLLNFTLAWRDDSLVGCAGLERYGSSGLLRSVVVKETERGYGLGQALTQQILEQARSQGITQIVLLTETAGQFFPRFGFAPITRAEAPEETQASVEFTTACPESALVMRLAL